MSMSKKDSIDYSDTATLQKQASLKQLKKAVSLRVQRDLSETVLNEQ